MPIIQNEGALFRILFNTMLEGVAVLDVEGNIILANPAAEHLIGLTQADLKTRNFLMPEEIQLFRSDHSPLLPTELAGARALREQCPVRNVVVGVKFPDMPLIWLLANAAPIFDQAGALIGVISVFADITDRKEAYEALQESEARYRGVLDVIDRLIHGVDAPEAEVDLTPRQIDIVRLVARGYSNDQIGEELNISEKTVRHYVSTINGKLKTKNRVQMALYALRQRFVSLHDDSN